MVKRPFFLRLFKNIMLHAIFVFCIFFCLHQSNCSLESAQYRTSVREALLNTVIHFGKEYYLTFEEVKWCYLLTKYGVCCTNEHEQSFSYTIPFDVVKLIFGFASDRINVLQKDGYILFDTDYMIKSKSDTFPLKIEVLLLKNPFIDLFLHSKKVLETFKKQQTLPLRCSFFTVISHETRDKYTLKIATDNQWKEKDVFFPFTDTCVQTRGDVISSIYNTISIYDLAESKKQNKDIIKEIDLGFNVGSLNDNTYVIQQEYGFYIVAIYMHQIGPCKISKQTFLDLAKPKVYIFFLSSLDQNKATLIQTILLPFLIHVAPKERYPWNELQDNINKNKDWFILSPFYTTNIKYINGQIFFEYDRDNKPLTNTHKPKLIIEWESGAGARATLFDSLMDIDKRIDYIANLFSCNESCMAEKTVDITVSSSYESSDNKEENQLTIITQSELQEKNELPTNEVTTAVDEATKGSHVLNVERHNNRMADMTHTFFKKYSLKYRINNLLDNTIFIRPIIHVPEQESHDTPKNSYALLVKNFIMENVHFFYKKLFIKNSTIAIGIMCIAYFLLQQLMIAKAHYKK